MDLKTNKLVDLPEYKYMATLNEEELTNYFAKGLQTLKNVGIVAAGISKPSYPLSRVHKAKRSGLYMKECHSLNAIK